MLAFLSGLRYDFRWNFICLTDQLPEIRSVRPSCLTGKFDGGPITKHQNTGPTERQNFALHFTVNNIPLKVNNNSFPVLKLKVLCGNFQPL